MMTASRVAISLAVWLGAAGAALAQDACVEPPVPARLDGTASADKMRAGLNIA